MKHCWPGEECGVRIILIQWIGTKIQEKLLSLATLWVPDTLKDTEQP